MHIYEDRKKYNETKEFLFNSPSHAGWEAISDENNFKLATYKSVILTT